MKYNVISKETKINPVTGQEIPVEIFTGSEGGGGGRREVVAAAYHSMIHHHWNSGHCQGDQCIRPEEHQ